MVKLALIVKPIGKINYQGKLECKWVDKKVENSRDSSGKVRLSHGRFN